MTRHTTKNVNIISRYIAKWIYLRTYIDMYRKCQSQVREKVCGSLSNVGKTFTNLDSSV